MLALLSRRPETFVRISSQGSEEIRAMVGDFDAEASPEEE
jgi:hypothetical protein